jgi:hypothetical protein
MVASDVQDAAWVAQDWQCVADPCKELGEAEYVGVDAETYMSRAVVPLAPLAVRQC